MSLNSRRKLRGALSFLLLAAILASVSCVLRSPDDPVNRRPSAAGKTIEELSPPGGVIMLERKEPIPRCSHCLAEVEKGSKVCPRCGKPLP